jgi:hypothetical protein
VPYVPSDNFNLDLSLFAGLITVAGLNPTDLPAGASPDNADVFYIAGSVATRPALIDILPMTVPDPVINSVKDFPTNSGKHFTNFLGNNGNLYSNDPTNPSSTVNLATFAAGGRFKSENYDGKQWYALFNPVQSAAFAQSPFVGNDAPRYYNGTEVYRVTSDAPGVSPTFSNLSTSPIPLAQTASTTLLNVTSAVTGGGVTFSNSQQGLDGSFTTTTVTTYSYITFTCTAGVPSNVLGSNVVVYGLTGANASLANISGEITLVAGSTFQIPVNLTVAVNLTGQSGSAAVVGNYMVRQGNIVTAYIGNAQPEVLVPGYFVTVQNTDTTLINGPSWNIETIGRDATGLVTVTINQSLTNLPSGAVLYIEPDAANYAGTVTATMGAPTISWLSGTQFDPSWAGSGITIGGTAYSILSVPNPTSMTLTSDVATASGTYSYDAEIVAFPTGFQTVYEVLGNNTASQNPASNFTLVQTALNSQNGATCTAAFSQNTTVGNTILMAIMWTRTVQGSIPSSVTDTQGNSYSAIAAYPLSEYYGFGIYAAKVTAAGATTINVTCPTGGGVVGDFVQLLAHELYGVAGISALDGSSIVRWGNSATTQTTPAITTANAPDVVFSFAYMGSAPSVASGNFQIAAVESAPIPVPPNSNLKTANLASAYALAPAAGSFSCQWNQPQLGGGFGATIGFTLTPTPASVGGSTTFTFTSDNTLPATSSVGGVVYQQWSPTYGFLGTAAQVLDIGLDPVNGWYFQFFQLGPDTAISTTNGTPVATIQSQLAPGVRQAVVIFTSQDGAQTAPSVPVSLNVQGGSNLVFADDIPVGPPGTASRAVCFTPAQGDLFFYLSPATIPAVGYTGPQLTIGTVISDNVTTSAIFDFSDTALTSAVYNNISEQGNNLFEQVVLPPCLGVAAYQDRLVWWGAINTNQELLNMGFDGGALPNGSNLGQPLGWTIGDGNGVLVQVPGQPGYSYQMTGGYPCLISQPAYQSYYGAPVVFPNTTYCFRVFASASTTGTAGNVCADFYSPSMGIQALATIPAASIGTTASWVVGTMNAALPNQIPTDLQFRVYQNGVPSGVLPGSPPSAATITLDEMEIIPTAQPVLQNQAYVSYVQNPFGYDALTGIIQVDSTDPITAAFVQRQFLYLLTDQDLFQSQDNGQTEPSSGTGWPVTKFAALCGASGPNAVDTGEDIAIWAGRYGTRLFSGAPNPKKVTQEIATIYENINWNVQTNIWVKNDPVQQVIYLGIPLGTDTQVTQVANMSYRLSDVAYNVPDAVHISVYSGRIISTDLGRKWTVMRRPLQCADMCQRNTTSGLAKILTLGGTKSNLYVFDYFNYPPLGAGIFSAGGSYVLTVQEIGPYNPGIGQNSGSGSAWSNPGNITVGNPATYATVTVPVGGSSDDLQALAYNIAVPAGSTIQGVQVNVTGKENATFTNTFALTCFPQSLGTELLTNPGFETGDFTGWSTHTGMSIGTSVVHSGTYAAYTSATGATMAQNPYNGTGYVRMSHWVQAAPSAYQAYEYDYGEPAMGQIGCSAVNTPFPSLVGQWSQVIYHAVAFTQFEPTGPWFPFGTVQTAHPWYIDDVSMKLISAGYVATGIGYTTSLHFAVGTNTYTVAAGLPYTAGQTIMLSGVNGPSGPFGGYLIGTVTSYSGTSLTVNVTVSAGEFSGTFALYITAVYDSSKNESIEFWFQTTTTDGGMLVSINSDPNLNNGGNYIFMPRAVYMGSDGKLGIWNYQQSSAGTTLSYNDGNLHHCVVSGVGTTTTANITGTSGGGSVLTVSSTTGFRVGQWVNVAGAGFTSNAGMFYISAIGSGTITVAENYNANAYPAGSSQGNLPLTNTTGTITGVSTTFTIYVDGAAVQTVSNLTGCPVLTSGNWDIAGGSMATNDSAGPATGTNFPAAAGMGFPLYNEAYPGGGPQSVNGSVYVKSSTALMNACMSHVSVFEGTALSSTQVTAHYDALLGTGGSQTNYESVVTADAPTYFWYLNEPSGATIAIDYVGGNNGTYVGTVNLGGTYPLGSSSGSITGSLLTITPANPVAGAEIDTFTLGLTNSTVSFGGPTDLWGMPTWNTAAAITAATFGFQIQAKTPTASNAIEFEISEVQVDVWYVPPQSWNASDADYGDINAYYVTYFFFDHTVEQQPLIQMHRKLYGFMATHVIGVGDLLITPYADALSNPQAPLIQIPLKVADYGYDIEQPMNAYGDRMSFKVEAVGAGNAFQITQMIVAGRQDRVFPIRGSIF